MKVEVKVAYSFRKQAKPFLKKYPSLDGELSELQKQLLHNPKLGEALGLNAYKIRLAVKSKGKGKSGGLRVISFLEVEMIGFIEQKENIMTVNLISIYDKSDTATISRKELIALIRKVGE